jgi:hypothetical protein
LAGSGAGLDAGVTSDAGIDAGKKPLGDDDGGAEVDNDAGVAVSVANGVSWSGTTSQGRAISFDISDDGMTAFRIQYAFPGCDGDNTQTFSPPEPLASPFSVSFPLAGATSITFAGTFFGTDRASGTIAFRSMLSPDQPACGAGGLTWTATRQ